MGEGFCAGLFAACLAVACSGPSGGNTVASACENVFDTLEESPPCAVGPQLPASQVSSEKARYLQVCEGAFALPGVSVTASQLNACTSSVQAALCNQNQDVLTACSFAGSLPGGSACNSGYQCTSGTCTLAGANANCGTCATTVAEGGSCLAGGTIACALGTQCDNGTCTKIAFGGVGASCDGVALLCGADLYCDFTTQQCVAPPSAGAPCPNGYCATSLVCAGPTSARTCQAPLPTGGDCQDDTQCAAGLGCDTSSQKCAAVTWASGGEPCGNLVRCLVESCPIGGTTCPTIIPDGQPCSVASTTSVCDIDSSCVNGTCVLGYSVVCK